MRLAVTLAWLVPSALLFFGGLLHLLTHKRLVSALREQRLLPASVIPATSRLVVAIEVGGGSLAILAGVVGLSNTTRIAMFSVAVVYLSFSAYLLILVTRRPGAACGCLGDGRPANTWTVGRAAILATCSLVAAVALPTHSLEGSLVESSLTVLIGVSLSVLVWALPGALHDPAAEARRSGLEVYT